MYDVYWLVKMVMITSTSQTTGLKYLKYNPGSELNILLWTMNNEKQKNQMENKMMNKIEYKLNNNKKIEQQ